MKLPHQPTRVVDAAQFGLSPELPPVVGFVTEDVPPELRPFVPKVDPDYVFSDPIYRILAAWFKHGADCPLYISGPAGAGKTSLALQVAARLNLPVFDITARLRMDPRELTGRFVMGKDGMNFRYGPAARAWMTGGIFLVNEFTSTPPETWVSSNSILERSPIHIAETGEVIEPHPMTRIICTDNTRGLSNDQEAGYLGRSLQDRSVMDRTWNVRIEGLSWKAEKRLLMLILQRDFPGLPEEVVERIVELWLNVAADAEKASAETNLGFESTMPRIGHRVLLRLTTLTGSFLSGDFPLPTDVESAARAVETIARVAFAESLDDTARGAFLQLSMQRWGDRLAELAKRL